MKKIKFKSALFGFKRSQVLSYVNQTCMEYEGMLQSQQAAHQEAVKQWQASLQQVNASLENSRAVCSKQELQLQTLQEQLAGKEQSLKDAAALADSLMNRLQGLSAEVTGLQATLFQKEQQLAGKDAFIASQTMEVSKLQGQVATLEEEFTRLKGQTQDSTALVSCLNVLHDRNRDLISQIATLETRLEDVTHGEQVEEHTKAAIKNQQIITSTEQLFNALRKEIGDAVETISSKIESGGISESADGKYFVDMANL